MQTPATLNVRGSASKDAAPDYAVVAINVGAESPRRADAVAEVEGRVAVVRAAVADLPGVRSLTLPRVRVDRTYHWDEASGTNKQTGWSAAVSGGVEVAADGVDGVISALLGEDLDVGWVSWALDDDNPVHRAVRTLAVEDAFRAAQDFADALGMALGDIRVLADAGLLGAGAGPGAPEPRMVKAMASPAAPSIELDPQLQRVSVSVEATFTLVTPHD